MCGSSSCVQSGRATSLGPASTKMRATSGDSLRLSHTAAASFTCTSSSAYIADAAATWEAASLLQQDGNATRYAKEMSGELQQESYEMRADLSLKFGE